MRAVVVGAGFAGLAAAEALSREGVEVRILEARDRVGGRVWSAPFAGGVAERGAEFILPGNTVVADTAARLGLRLIRKGTLYGAREPWGVAAAGSAASLAASVERLLSRRPPSEAGTVHSVLRASDLDPDAQEAVAARLEVSCAYPAEDLDASALAEGAGAFGDYDTFSIEGGNDRIARVLAAGLGERISLGAAVTRIAWSGEEARVLTAGGFEYAADAVVVATPASVVDRIEFDPPLPEAKLAALGAVRYGCAAKLHVRLRRAVAPSQTLSVPGRFWCYTQLGADGRPVPFVGAFAGTAAALERLVVAEGPARWLEALSEMRPDLELDIADVLLSRWDGTEPWVRGAYSARSPGSPLLGPELARPVGPLAFAGEHTAGDWHGLMEGALRSGQRAAEEVMRAAREPKKDRPRLAARE